MEMKGSSSSPQEMMMMRLEMEKKVNIANK